MNATRNVVYTSIITLALAAPALSFAETAPSQKTRAQVEQELAQFQANPVSADGRYRFAGAEIGWVPVAHEIAFNGGRATHVDKQPHETKDRAQIDQELAQFKANPVSESGQFRFAGAEIGWVPVPHQLALNDGKLTHVDQLSHDSKAPSLEMTPAEKAQQNELFRPWLTGPR